jgi:AcrR family transcriptional regulator
MAVDTSDGRPDTSGDKFAESSSPRDRILRAAAMLLAEGGREAVSTRAVSAVAGVQPPTIYRQFGDMGGLLDAVAEDGFARYLRDKIARADTEDPVADLRAGWDAHVGFGLANPALYALMYGEPRPGSRPAAAVEARRLLEGLVRRVAAAGRLRVGVGRATRLIQAAGVGVVLTLIAAEEADRDLDVSPLTREAILAAVTTDTIPINGASAGAGSRRVAAHAVALKAVLPEAATAFTPAERGLLAEWLGRLIREP